MAEYLRATGAEARLEEFLADAATAEAAADAVGCALAQIVKSLVFVCGRSTPSSRSSRRPPRRPRQGRARSSERRGPGREAGRGRTRRPVSRPAPSRPSRCRSGRRVVRRADAAGASPSSGSAAGSTRHLVRLAPHELARLTRARGGRCRPGRRTKVDLTTPTTGGSDDAGDREDLDERRARRLGRREGPRRRPRAALRHRRLRRDPLLRDAAGPRRLPARATTSSGCATPARLLYMEIPYTVEELREATHDVVSRERSRRLLHPADRVLRVRRARRLTRAETPSTR